MGTINDIAAIGELTRASGILFHVDAAQSTGKVEIDLEKRIPAEGDFRTNIHAGASAAKHEITDSDRRICEQIKDRLVKDRLFFVGVDIIGDKLVEINVVSPGGIPRINRLSNLKIEARVIDWVEDRVRRRRSEGSQVS
ncbi:MAG: aminotransferase class V-fold PLP-dependent enzyme [Desulfarculus sp.]|nr:aminotransferase class V-fold PLP-dependent enzyme [Desulfarculus sp.]